MEKEFPRVIFRKNQASCCLEKFALFLLGPLEIDTIPQNWNDFRIYEMWDRLDFVEKVWKVNDVHQKVWMSFGINCSCFKADSYEPKLQANLEENNSRYNIMNFGC